MRRLLALVLLVLLPVQFSWAAVASYCAHEAASAGHASGHFGHHEHHHPADATAGAEPGSEGDAAGLAAESPPGTLDADCGHCHGTCSVMPLVPQVWPGLPAAPLPSAAAHEACSGHAPARPERPQWRPLA